MGVILAFSGAMSGVFADQWREIITAGTFDKYTLVAPGILKRKNNGRGINVFGSDGVITNGSKIFVPENTAAFIFSKDGLDSIITEPGGYTFQRGEGSIFNEDRLGTIANQIWDRVKYGGQPVNQIYIAFVNLREIRGIPFGTESSLVYNDSFYGTDLGIVFNGSFSIRVTNPRTFILNYIPANTLSYTFRDKNNYRQISSEFKQSFLIAINALSNQFRISQLPSHTDEIVAAVMRDKNNVGTWERRFGFRVVSIGVTHIGFDDESKELVKQYSSNKMNLKAYEDVSQTTSNIGAQQKIAEGIQSHGLGDAASLIFGMNIAQSMNKKEISSGRQEDISEIDKKIELLEKLKDLTEKGILTEQEFEDKKKKILNDI